MKEKLIEFCMPQLESHLDDTVKEVLIVEIYLNKEDNQKTTLKMMLREVMDLFNCSSNDLVFIDTIETSILSALLIREEITDAEEILHKLDELGDLRVKDKVIQGLHSLLFKVALAE